MIFYQDSKGGHKVFLVFIYGRIHTVKITYYQSQIKQGCLKWKIK